MELNCCAVSLSKWSIPPDRFDDCYVQFLTSEMMLRLLVVSTVLILGEASAQPRWTFYTDHEENVATFMIAHWYRAWKKIKWNSVRYCWWELLRTEIILSGSKPSGNLGRATCTRTTSRTTRGTSTSVCFTIIATHLTNYQVTSTLEAPASLGVQTWSLLWAQTSVWKVKNEDVFWYYYY